MANRIQLRRDGAQQWANVNPILAQGELGIEIDTSRLKIGDGVTAWNSLKYERPLETESNTANTLVKRDADGNFEAGAITASLIGNAATATRLANARQIQLGGDMSGSGTFDGSSNLTITAELNYVVNLPHYDPQDLDATGTYTRITVDSRGRIVNADNPSALSDFGITDAQPLDSDLTSLAGMSGFGFISRQAEGNLVNRTITGGSGRIIVQNGNAQTSNPFIDLADTTVVVGKYNPITAMDPLVDPLVSATTGEETVNTVNLQVDRYGRLIYANTSPIATATQGAKDGTSFTVYDNATAYPRFSKIIASNGRTYQAAIRAIPAGLGEPSHNTQNGDQDDQGGWRDLGTDGVEQKGVASFDQEDFDVDANGHVTISENAIENSQMQSHGLLMFTDQNATETFELDRERTTDNAYHGITTINHVNVNNRTGGSVFRVVGYDTAEYPFQPGILDQGNTYPAVAADDPNGNGSADWGSIYTGLIDINLDTTIAGNITLDVTKTNQFIKRTSGNVDFHLDVNEAADRNMNITANNADGGGTANINITADNEITISSTDAAYFVNVEDYRFQYNVLSTRDATMVLDPGDDDAATGLVQIRGDLQVDGTTTTVNSVVMTVQDPIITLGGEDTLVADDNKDRGIEFRYYDTQERFGFYGWDEDYADSNIWNGTGGYRFLYNATNSSEVFSGTDAAIIAGNLRLTTNTDSTWKTPTTGTLVVTGGAGISANLNVGGTTYIQGNTEIDGTVDIDANFAVRTAGHVNKVTIESATGNTVIEGTLDVQLDTEITDNLTVRADNKEFKIQTDAGVTKFVVDTDNGNSVISGTVNIIGATDIDDTLNVDGDVTFNSNFDLDGQATFHDTIHMDTGAKEFKISNGGAQKFQVSTTNGNTDIEGSLNVGGFNTFERTNNIAVDATTSESDITLATDGAITVAGGVNIEKDVRIATDLYVADRIVVKDAGTARTRPSLLNNVDVLYRQVIGATAAHNATFATDTAANLRVTGGVGIGSDLHIGDDLYIGKLNTNDTVEFSVLGESGYTTIGRVGQGNATDGALVVHGDATFNRELNITGSLTTIGNSNTDVLTVNAVTTYTDDVTIEGNLEVDQNVIINQNLTVHGTTTTVNSTVVTLDDPIVTLGGDTAPASNDGKDRGVEFRYYDSTARVGFFGWDNSASRYALYHNATNSSEVFAGTRSGLDAGSAKFFDTTNATSATTGTLIVGGGVGIGLDLFVGDDLNVTDDVTVGGNIAATGAISTQSNFAVQTVFSVMAGTGNTYVGGTLQVQGNATIGNAGSDAHTVNGTVQFNHALTGAARANIRDLKIGTDAANEIGTLFGNLILDSAGGTVNITDNADVDGDLNVDGNTQIDGTLTVDGNVTLGNAGTDAHVVTGTVTFNQAITSTDITADNIKIGVDGATEISTTTGNLILDSAGGKVHVTDNAEIDGFLQVDGNTILGNAASDTLTVNATSTFNAAITSTDITADSVQIGVSGASEIDTSAGNLTLDSTGGTVIVDDNLNVTGSSIFTGQMTVNDSIIIDSTNEAFIIRSSLVDRFTVDSDNGNTFIAGTTQIEGLTTINDNVDINGNTDVSGTQTIGGVTTITDTSNPNLLSLFLNIGSAALDVAGGAKFGGNVAVGGDIQVYGDFTVDGNQVSKGNQEFSGRVEFSKNETPTRLVDNAPLMVTNGGITVYEDSFFGEDIYIGPDQAATITLFGATGNATFDGTVGVSTLNATTGNIATVNTTSNVNVGGSIIVNTNKFIVAGASGNTDIAGTLDVAGNTVLAAQLNVQNAVDFDSTLNVDGATTFNATITQNSTSLFRDNVVVRGASKVLQLQNGANVTKVELQSTTGNIIAAGLTQTNTLDVVSNATIGGTLGVTGQITGNVTGDLTGTADKALLVDVTETATSNLTYYPAFVSSNNGFTEVRTDSSNLTYNPSTNTLTVNNFKSTTDFEVQGNLNVTGTITFFQSQVGSIANHDTDDLVEGVSNLYFTNERVDDRVAALISGGTGISATYDDLGNLLTLSAVQSDINTDNLTEGGTNLFTTAARTRTHFTYGTGIQLSTGDLSIAFNEFTSDDIVEGAANLFITDARVRGALSASGDLNYNASTGEFSISQSDLNVDDLISLTGRANGSTHLAAFTGSTISDNNTIKGALQELETSLELKQDTSGLGTAAFTASTAYATAAQGTLADSAVQPADNISTLTNDSNFIDAAGAPVQSVAGKTGAVSLVKGDVGLGNVDNTSDVNKPVSTAQQTALDLKADLASPALTGTPTAPTAAQATNTTQVATTAFVQSNLTASLLRAALGIPEYANNGAATSGGAASGSMYYNTTDGNYQLVS